MKKLFPHLPRGAVALLAATLGACATTGGDIVPVEERGARAPAERSEVPPVARAEIPPPAAPRPSNAAVEALLAQALEASRNGDHASAVSLLERAQRIEPRNPLVWNRLALVRLQQGQYAQAESLALKSNLYAGGSPDLRLRNWRLIAEARRQQGDSGGMREAERQVQALEAGR